MDFRGSFRYIEYGKAREENTGAFDDQQVVDRSENLS
jgi:hypothetical protein